MFGYVGGSRVGSGDRRSRLPRRTGARPFRNAAGSLLALAAIGAAALASGAVAPEALAATGSVVTSLTVRNSSPTAAAGARTVYSITFNVSPRGSLSSAAVSSISIALPPGTGFAGYNSSSVVDDTTANQIGNCGGPNRVLITCSLFSGDSVRGGDKITVTLGGIANPTRPGSYRVSVSTTSDRVATVSPSFAVVADPALGTPHVSMGTPSAAAGARTVYSVGFSVPPSGGLASAANSTITIGFPNGTDFSGYNSSSVADITTGLQIGNCGGASRLGTGTAAVETITCNLYNGAVASPKDGLTVTLGGIANPVASGDYALKVSTTSNIAAVRSSNYRVTARGRVSAPTMSIGVPSAAAGARTIYQVSFAVSSTGGLSSVANSSITLTFAPGTGFAGYNSSSVLDDTTGVRVGNCGGAAKTVITCGFFGGAVVNGGVAGGKTPAAPVTLKPGGDRLTVTLGGISNPAAGRTLVTVATTSDTFPTHSALYSVLAAGHVSQPTVTQSSSTGGAQVTYEIRFAVSASGGLSGAANSAITLTFPTGTSFAGYRGSSVVDATTGLPVGNCGGPSGEVVVCQLFSGSSVNGGAGREVVRGDSVGVGLTGLANPITGGRYTLSVSTTSDTTVVKSASYLVRSPV